MIGAILGALQVVQGVASLFGGQNNASKPSEATDNAAQAAGSSSTSQGQPISALPTVIQNALNTSGKVLANYSTNDLLKELGKRPEAAKTFAPSAPVPQASTASADSVAAASNTDTENATATNTPTATAESNPTNARTSMQNGKAVFQNDNYIIAAGDDNKVTIYNKKTKEVYEAVGDASMKIDGKAGFSGKGTMSLMLNDGTKVTMGRADDGKGGTLASKLTITNGAYGAQIKGIDTTKAGDLAVQEFSGQGKELDEQVTDGVMMEENQDININNGRGFVVKDANGAATLVSKDYLAKVSNGGMKADNLDQFDLPGGEQQAETASQATATGSTLNKEPVQQNQAATSAPANAAGTGAIQDQFAKNQALRKPIDCFGNARQAKSTNQNQSGNGDVRNAQSMNTTRRTAQPNSARQPVQTSMAQRRPDGKTYEALGQASRRPAGEQRSPSTTSSGRSAPATSQTRENGVRTPPAVSNRKVTAATVNFQKPVYLDMKPQTKPDTQMLDSRSSRFSTFAGAVPNYKSNRV